MNGMQTMGFDNTTIDLRTAARYVRHFCGRVFVVKLGGDVLAKPQALQGVCEQLALLWSLSIPLVVVHGAGPQLDLLSEKLGVAVEKRGGRRVTDAAGLQAAKHAFGAAQTDLLAALRAAGLSAVGLSGVSAGLVAAHARPGDAAGDWGFVGDIDAIDPAVLKTLLTNNHVPVIAPLSGDDAGGVYNTNADTLAAAMAGALQAEKLIYLMGAPGLLADPDDVTSLVPAADVADLDAMADQGALQGGMQPKAAAAKEALAAGVGGVHLISGQLADALLVEVFTNEGSGTMITPTQTAETLSATVQAQA